MLNWDPTKSVTYIRNLDSVKNIVGVKETTMSGCKYKVGERVIYKGLEYRISSIEKTPFYSLNDGTSSYKVELERAGHKILVWDDDLEVMEDEEMNNNKDVKNCRAYILDEAKRCICGERENQYGNPENNFNMIASLWNDYLYHGLREDQIHKIINATDVAMMMALLKIARIRTGEQKTDSFIDLAGYAACGGEISVNAQADETELEDLLNDICPE